MTGFRIGRILRLPSRIAHHSLKGHGTERARKQNACLLLIGIHRIVDCMQKCSILVGLMRPMHYFLCVCIYALSLTGFLFILRLTSQPDSGRKRFCQCEDDPGWEAGTTHVLPSLNHSSQKSPTFVVPPSLAHMSGIPHSVQHLVVSNDS